MLISKNQSIAFLWSILILLVSVVLYIWNRKDPIVIVSSEFTVLTLNDFLIDPETFRVKPERIIYVRNLLKSKTIFLFTVKTPECETSVRSALVSAQIDIPSHRVLFTSTVEGRGSIARELQPDLFIDPSTDLVASLKGKVPIVEMGT